MPLEDLVKSSRIIVEIAFSVPILTYHPLHLGVHGANDLEKLLVGGVLSQF